MILLFDLKVFISIQQIYYCNNISGNNVVSVGYREITLYLRDIDFRVFAYSTSQLVFFLKYREVDFRFCKKLNDFLFLFFFHQIIHSLFNTTHSNTLSNMSLSMVHSIAFAKWFLNKFRANGIIVDGNDFDFVLSQLDQNSWDEFIATSDSIAKTTADVLIPTLVEKMPKKIRSHKSNENNTKIKSKKTRVDAQTSTDSDSIKEQDNVEGGDQQIDSLNREEVVPSPEKVVPVPSPEKVVKKRAPKKVKGEQPKTDIEGGDQQIDSLNREEVVAVPEKVVKKRAPKKVKEVDSIKEQDNVEGGDQQIDSLNREVVAVPEKVVKKRAPKKVKDVKEVNETKSDSESNMDSKEEDSKKNKKNFIVVPDDVIIPVTEQTILGADDLQEDYYQNELELELTEVFINDVLFYKDANNNWYDQHLTPFRIEDAQLAAFSHETPSGRFSGESSNSYAHASLRNCPHSSLITAREAGVLNEKRCNTTNANSTI